MHRTMQVVVFVLACALLMAAVAPLHSIHAQALGPNLLVGGDFESTGTWPQQDNIGEVQVAPGWRAYYLDAPPPGVALPNNCPSLRLYDCYWMRPEFRDNTSFANRIHSGARSQKYFSFGRMHEAGLMQRVTNGIKPGATYHFAIFMQAWQCFDIDKCGKNGTISDAPANMHLRVGIDPTGGTDPYSPNIVWSAEQEAFDRWVEFSVEARAQAGAVTVYTHSRAEWDWARMDNDVYLDDGSLVEVAASGRTNGLPATSRVVPAAAAAAAAAPVASTTTAAVAPGGTYVIQPGDTLTIIAKKFGVTVPALMALNNITDLDKIYSGQRLLIPATGTAGAASPASVTSPAVPSTSPAPSLGSGGSWIDPDCDCVRPRDRYGRNRR